MKKIVKFAQSVVRPQIIQPESIEQDDPELVSYFKKKANDLKTIAPKANDFLYFSCIMMHAAEASALDENGELRKTADGKPVEVGFDVLANGSLKWRTNDLSIFPHANNNCLVPGTDILMGDGSCKRIEEIAVGDEVITHLGRVKKVTEIFKHENNSKIFNVKSVNSPLLQVTSEHPILTLTSNGVSVITEQRLRDVAKTQIDTNWKKAEDIHEGDLLLSIKDFDIKVDSDLTPDQARLLGYFAAEGCYLKKYNKLQGVHFTFNFKELNLAEYVKELFTREFPECSVIIKQSELRGVTTVTATGFGIAEWFYYHIGEYSLTKKLSKEIVFSPNNEVKRQFLLGWLEGDGCYAKGNRIIGITSSPHLAWQTTVMLRSLGASTSIRKVESTNKMMQIKKEYGEYQCSPHYRIEVYGGNADLICGDDSIKYKLDEKAIYKNPKNTFDRYYLHRVTQFDSEDYVGSVFNFEVEDDHSYIANGIIVHNSDSFPRAELKKAYKKWVGKPLCLDHQSSSVDHVRGIIVDTVYDDKRDRIIALCAVDKVNYPDLARKIASGYAASVSMGTAVGRAICYDCQTVARYEAEFCQHMRTKTARCEINVDLNPIELSIVVNPADPGAKIRRVIASANSVAEYVDSEEVSDEDKKGLLVEKISNLDSELSSAISELKEMESNSLPYRSTPEMVSDDSIEEAKESLQGLKSVDSFITEASEAINMLRKTLTIINKMASDKEDLNKSEKDSKMTEKRAYFQGGGDVNEPTLGQTKYPAEPLDRNDKQMQGIVDSGSDGLFPGDEEKKRSLQRLAAAAERSRLRREAAKKTAYYQGTEEPAGNGKPTYTPDPLLEKTRKEDKQMVGEKPFPDVGKVDEMYPGDEEKKEKVGRASSYKAKFVKAAKADGSDDLAQSRWDIYDVASGKPALVLTATVAELAGDVKRAAALYSAIATKDFGLKILASVRSEGVSGAAKIFKVAQAAPVAAPTAPEAVAAPVAPEAAPMPEMPMGEEPVDYAGEAGTPAEKLQQIADELDNIHADLAEAVEALNEDAEISEEVPAMEGELATTAAFKVRTQRAITSGFKEALEKAASLKDEIEVIRMIKDKGVKKSEVSTFNSLTSDAVKDFGKLKVEASVLMKSLKKYAEACVTLEKKAQYADRQVGDTTKVPGYILSRVRELAPKAKRSGTPVAQLAEQICNEFYTECVEQRGLELGIKQAITNFYYPEMKGQMTHVPNDVASADDTTIVPGFILDWMKQNASGKISDVDFAKETMETFGVDEFSGIGKGIKQLATKLVRGSSFEFVGNDRQLADDKKPVAKSTKPAGSLDGYEGDPLAGFDNEILKADDSDKKAQVKEWLEKNLETYISEDGEVDCEALSKDLEEEFEDEDENDAVKVNSDGSFEGSAQEVKEVMKEATQSRNELRAKLAQKATQFADILGKAHPSSTVLDIETKGDGAKIETLEEVHKRMEEVATAPVKVKEAAEKIQKLVVAGKIDPAKDFPGLIAEGLDASAVSFWKKYFGEAKDKDSSAYVSELVKSYETKKTASEKTSERVKMARAYELAYEMAEKGLITKKEVSKQASKILDSDDKNFEFLKTTVASFKGQKQAILPEVGIQENLFSSQSALPNKVASTSLVNEFESFWAGRKF